MSEPKTLFQLAGAPVPVPRFSESVVIIIDAQREYVDGALPLDGIAPALEAVGRVLAGARAAGAPVIHIAHHGAPGSGGPFDPQAPGFAFAAPALPIEGESVIGKRLPSSFAGTDLLATIRATGRSHLILAGFMTHMCVSTTARAALDHGFTSFVVGDACATRALPDPLGGPALAASEVHRAALAEIADRFARVVRVSDLVA